MRSTSRCASAKGLMASGRLGRGADRAGARDARRVRPLLPRQRPRRGRGRRGRDERDPRRRERRRASWSARARVSGLPIRVLSREQEARYGYLAAVNSTTLSDGSVLDLGGGSMQLVRVADRLIARLGLVAARHGADERALPAAQRPRQAQAARGAARARRGELSQAHVARDEAGSEPRGGRLVGIGGTVRNLAAAAQRAAGPALERRPGHGDRARGARGARPAAGGAARRRARERAGHQARARGPDPRRRGGRPGRAARGRLRRARDDRGGPARGRVLRAPAGGAATSRCSRTCGARAC